jgi:hypothetical protein
MESKMNERIRALADEAEDYADSIVDQGGEFHTAYTHKFAELIVRECMEQIWYSREDGINGNVSQVIKDRITEHFGVEE